MVILVNRVFPFASVIRLSQHYNVTLAKPESPTQTRYFSYMLTLPIPDGGVLTEEGLARAKKDVAFLSDTGNQEDAKVVSDIQAAIGSGVNTHYRFGRFESAIRHLHRYLALHLQKLDECERDTIKIVESGYSTSPPKSN
ncbi:MAG: hypothetical protein HQ497_10095 [SAR86 cluster bacterium]|uniref:Aromatic-ring-hydroxylating dioxygenase alpha subunit C-terminal domain-containing protein n=1 Tax=SAR86 cluster bacterium TaxID=2030880 RepID=A0A973A9P7_9GAMM|nr:hypothetical protein [SAR86 cluster bacterium]